MHIVIATVFNVLIMCFITWIKRVMHMKHYRIFVHENENA
jgi:hypothetical protein